VSATLALAIWGSLSGSIATAAVIYSLLRDRPQVHATQEIHMVEDTEAFLVLTVTNTGKQPTTLLTAAFAVKTRQAGRWPRRRLYPTHSTQPKDEGPEVPMRLAPGDPVRVRLPLTWKVEQQVPQGFAEYGKGRISWATPSVPRDDLRSARRAVRAGSSSAPGAPDPGAESPA
jgi:hypothetical protein